MNRTKTDSRNSLFFNSLILNDLVVSYGFVWKAQHPKSSDGVGARCPNQSQRKKYKREKPKKHGPKTLIDLSSSEEESIGKLSVDL